MSKISFYEKLEKRRVEINSLLCIGLDPHTSSVSHFIFVTFPLKVIYKFLSLQLPEDTPEAARDFCINLVRETSDYTLAFKPNIAFFEQYGEKGFGYLKEVMSIIPSDIPIILDCKRGDISTTAEAYAKSVYNFFGTDAVTLAPYMGRDSVTPFLKDEYEGKGVFLLCKTSNNSSKVSLNLIFLSYFI